MPKRIFVRNLPPGTSREELRELGNKYGRVISAEIFTKGEGPPRGFISFLSKDDADYAIYRLTGYRYKNCILEVEGAFLKQKKEDQQRTNRPIKSEEKPKRNKKQMYSLRALTPLNPPTPSPQQQPRKANDQSQPFKSWQDHTPVHSPTGSSGDHPEENGYIPPNEKQVYEQTPPGGKSKRNNNSRYNNNTNNKSNFKKIENNPYVHLNPPPEIIESPTTDTAPPAVEGSYGAVEINEGGEDEALPVLVTDIEISIPATQNYFTFKVGPEQLQEFLKALNPFLQERALY
jgi:hypothetical protein